MVVDEYLVGMWVFVEYSLFLLEIGWLTERWCFKDQKFILKIMFENQFIMEDL